MAMDRMRPSNDHGEPDFAEVLRAVESQQAAIDAMTFEEFSQRVKERAAEWFRIEKTNRTGDEAALQTLVQLQLLTEGLREDFDKEYAARNAGLEGDSVVQESFADFRERVFVQPYMRFIRELYHRAHAQGGGEGFVAVMDRFEREFGGKYGLFSDYLNKAEAEHVKRRRSAIRSV